MLVLLVGALSVMSIPLRAEALGYGQGTYNSCVYQTGCPPAATQPQTIVSTPTVDYAINLTDGQTIPANGTTVIVTILHDTGQNVSKVEFYLDGALVQTSQHDTSDTYSWQWNPETQPGTKVEVIIYPVSGNPITRTFTLAVQHTTATPPQPTPLPLQSIEPEGFWQAAVSALLRFIGTIPAPIAYIFPYFLFALLAIVLLLLLIQTWREAAELAALRRALERDKALAEQKQTFIDTASHYLRTPSSVMDGALGLAIIQTPSPAWLALKDPVAAVHQAIEQVLQRVTGAPSAVTGANTPTGKSRAMWLRPGFIGTVLVLGLVAFGFDLMVALAGTLSVTAINVIAQVIIFVILSVLLYMLLRERTLRSRERQRLEQGRREQADIDQHRNELIRQSLASLQPVLQPLGMQLSSLGDGQPATLFRDGYHRLRALIDKFGVAQQLAIGKDQSLFEAFTAKSIIDRAIQPIAQNMQAKHVSLNYPPEVELVGRGPSLLAYVVTSLLDNAVAYSPEGAQVTITAANDGQGACSMTIADQGAGIPTDKQPLLFQPFVKADDPMLMGHDGIGLGLYLSKLIMTYLGGDISVSSQVNHGTTAKIIL